MNIIYIFLLMLLDFSTAYAAPEILLKSRIHVEGVVVGSACSVVIESGTSRSGVIDFGQYNKALRTGGVDKLFSIKLFENKDTIPGCSAFLAGSELVTLTFGDRSTNQLDEQGVITKGAGDSIRIAISSTDAGKVSSQRKITSKNTALTYSQDFAAKGVFGFNARVERLEEATTGDYHGSLSLVVTYQ